jgi:hypothetical protein
MWLPSADKAAAWDHCLPKLVILRLRRLIQPFATSQTLVFDQAPYAKLYDAPPVVWGNKLARYAIFQNLKRREDEDEISHEARLKSWLNQRRCFEWEQVNEPWPRPADRFAMWPDDGTNGFSVPLGTRFAKPKELVGSDLENWAAMSPTARVLIFDIAADKARQIAQISYLIDRERETASVPRIPRRGPKKNAKKEAFKEVRRRAEEYARKKAGLPPPPAYREPPQVTEYGQFIESLKRFHVVPLWDLQLAGLAGNKASVARALFPADARKSGRLEVNIPRVLLAKIDRAIELQDQVIGWVRRLRATI